jgi:nicotinamidase-related amidase
MNPSWQLDPAHTAVIAIDFQHDIVGPNGAFASMFSAEVERTHVIPAAARLLDDARAAGIKIVHCRAAFRSGYTDLVANIPLFANVKAYGCLIDGSTGATIIDAITPHDGDIVLNHHRVSCFQGTELDVVLRGAAIDTLVLTGVATNLAVESTARAGADLGYRIVVVSDACATTSEHAHDASLASLAMFADVIPADNLLAAPLQPQ